MLKFSNGQNTCKKCNLTARIVESRLDRMRYLINGSTKAEKRKTILCETRGA